MNGPCLGRDIEMLADRRDLIEEFEPALGSALEGGHDFDDGIVADTRSSELNIELLRRDDDAANEKVIEDSVRINGQAADNSPMASSVLWRALRICSRFRLFYGYQET